MSESLIFKNKKTYLKHFFLPKLFLQIAYLLIYHERPEPITHLSWETWAIRSLSLICLERSEWIVLIWFEQNEQMCEWAMSKWANEQIPSPATGRGVMQFTYWYSRVHHIFEIESVNWLLANGQKKWVDHILDTNISVSLSPCCAFARKLATITAFPPHI